jgi:hypothetical protein
VNLATPSISKPVPSTVYAETLADLAAIYEPHLNVVVHRRAVGPEVARYVKDALLADAWEQRLRFDGSRREPIAFPWPEPEALELRDDITSLVEIYAELFGAGAVGVRVVSASAAMCPRFHVDKVGVRMVCTYAGPGTEWLDNDSVRRHLLGHASNGVPDDRSGLVHGPVRQMSAFDIGLLKGEGWPDNVGRGAVHRSPAYEHRRLFMSLEAI